MPIRKLDTAELSVFSEYDEHVAVYEVTDDTVDLHGYIAIHRQKPDVAALGATRYWTYDDPNEALRSALRLSRLMSYKSLAAGLPYTGAKAVLVRPKQDFLGRKKRQILEQYATYLNELEGAFITGTDVGLKVKDVQFLSKHTQYVIGSGVDSGYYTAHGVVRGIQASLAATEQGDLSEQRFAVQGYGSTGSHLARLLTEAGATVSVADVKAKRFKQLEKTDTSITIVPDTQIMDREMDVFCPCALGGTITPETIPTLSASVVAGSANNQFYDESCDQLLFDAGILYAPDFVINSGGLISVVDEFVHGEHDDARIMHQLETISTLLEQIFILSRDAQIPTHAAAMSILKERL